MPTTLPPLSKDLLLCWRADRGTFSDVAGTTPAVADGTVALWLDQSANGIHGGQSTSGARPTLKANQINGMPCLRFDGGDYLDMANAYTPVETTMYAVIKIPSTSVYTMTCGRPNSLQWRMDGRKQRFVNSGVADIGFGTNLAAANTWVQINGSWNLTNGVFRQGRAADGSVTGTNGLSAIFRFGVQTGSGGFLQEYFQTDLAFLATFQGVHTTGQRQTIEDWINSVYGV